MRFLVLQHKPWEGPGRYAQFARNAGIELKTVELWKPGYKLPTPSEYRAYSAALIMGGSKGVNDPISNYKSKNEEIKFIQNFPNPILGTCLGSQLIAYAFGGNVYPDDKKECGFYPVRLTSDGKRGGLFRGFSDTFPVFHWHGDAFEIPGSAYPLVVSQDDHVQAFAYENKFGVLFHMEMTPEMITTLIEKEADWFGEKDGRFHGNTEKDVLRRAKELNAQMDRQSKLLFSNFCFYS